MPELPEVETVVRGLRTVLPGRRICGVRLGKTDFLDDPAALERKLPGSEVLRVSRFGKFVVLELAKRARTTEAEQLIIHLGMTGQLIVRAAAAPLPPHTHMVLRLDDGREVCYADSRRFGRIVLVGVSERERLLGRLGADALEGEPEELRRRLAGRRARIKALLLNQSVLRGLGNIYTDESLWRARIHPMRLAANLRSEEIKLLLRSIRKVLSEAIELRGSSISDYVDTNGRRGEFQLRHRVYQREGERCFRCRARIRRIIVAGRSSYFCPGCQRAPGMKRTKKEEASHGRMLTALRRTSQGSNTTNEISVAPTRLSAPA